MSSDLTPYVPRLLAEWQRDTPDAAFRAVEGTLVFADISGFTAMSERLAKKGKVGAEEVTDVLSASFENLLAAAYDEGGHLLKFGGDAMLLFFDGASHPERGVRAAYAMRRRLRDMGRFTTSAGFVSLRMSVGVHSGEVNFFLVGGSHREFIVAGPAVSRTVEMESAAHAGEILISDDTATAIPATCLGVRKAGGALLAKSPPPDARVRRAVTPPAFLDAATFVPDAIRGHLAAGIDESEHRQVTVAFLHFDNTDGLLAANGAVATATALDVVVRAAQDAVAEYGICFLATDIDKDGGKIILTAGAPRSTGSDEESMLRALRAIVDAQLPLPLRIGVNRGRIFAGNVGPPYRRTYTVMGDAVNLAARLMAKALPGQILATPDVLERSRTSFDLTPIEPFLVKGKAKPVTAFAVGPRVFFRADRGPARIPLIGREQELTTLVATLEGARAGERQVIEMTGEAGIGKSRLVEELQARAEGFVCVQSACEQYESSSPYFPFRRLLRSALAIPLDLDRTAASAALASRIAQVAPELSAWLPLIAIPLDLSVAATPEVDAIEPRFRKARLQQVVAALLARALDRPALIIIDELHWIDEASRDLLAEIISSSAQCPWLICVTRRPDEGIAVGEFDAASVVIALEPLSDEAARSLSSAVSGDLPLARHELEAIAARAGGNPLFLQEIVAAHASDVGALPDSVEALLSSRIDRLAPGERRLLRYASVFGPSFDAGFFAESFGDLLPESSSAAWHRLSEFVVADGDAAGGSFRFRHALVREAAYEGLPFRRRRELHARLAESIERRAGADADRQAELLSLHFERAQSYAKAWRYARLAGERSHEKSANVEAAEFYRRALDASRHVPQVASQEVATVYEALGDVSELSAAYEAASRAYARARAALPADAAPARRLLRKEGVVRERLGRYAQALRWYGRGLRGLGTGGITDKVQLSLAYAGVRFRQGKYADCARWCNSILADAQSSGDRASLAHAYYLLSHAYTLMGNPENSRYRYLALPIYEELGDYVGQANVLNNLGVAAYYEGKWEQALTFYRRSKEARERAGDVVGSATASNNIGEILSDQGLLEEATELFTEALQAWRAARYPVGIALARSNLGRAAVRSGRLDEADGLLADALAGFREIRADSYVLETQARIAERWLFAGDPERALDAIGLTLGDAALGELVALKAMVYRLRGYALSRRAEFDDARRALDESLRLARSISAEYEIALTLQALASLAEATGESPAPYLRESVPIFERLGVVAMSLTR